jgi:hypothetical protein
VSTAWAQDDSWMSRAEIERVRTVYREIHIAAEAGLYTQVTREIPCGFADLDAAVSTDSSGVARVYELLARSDAASRTLEYYYDAKGVLRFVLASSWAPNSSHTEERLYFNESGDEIYHDTRLLEGQAWSWGPTPLVEDAGQHFGSDGLCREAFTFAEGSLPRHEKEEVTLQAVDADQRQRVDSLAVRRQIVDSLIAMSNDRLKLFAQLGTAYETSDSIVPVLGRRWPRNTDASFAVLVDSTGAVLAGVETPTSYSGDWHNSYTHYFDSFGRTVVFHRVSSFFNMCDIFTEDDIISRPAREHSVYYYSDDGRLIEKEYSLATLSDGPIDPSECGFMYRFNYTVHRTWEAFAWATGLPMRP